MSKQIVGVTGEVPEKLLDTIRKAKVPEEYNYLNKFETEWIKLNETLT